MSLIEYTKGDTLHHAYLIEGTNENIFPELKRFFIKDLQFETDVNPDFWYGEFDTFGIGDGRDIKQLQTRKSFSGNRKIFVIVANFFTTEAQNSLLKMFEEPTEETHFFVITQNTETLLPTLRSRMQIIRPRIVLGRRSTYSKELSLEEVNIDDFLKNNKTKRILMLKSIIDNKDKNGAVSFLNELEKTIADEGVASNTSCIKEIIKCKKYLNGSSPSVKMILEHISLVV